LWTIGNVKGPGSKGPIDNVHLSVVYDLEYEQTYGPLSISLTPTTAGGVGPYNGFVDPSVAGSNDPQVAGGPIDNGRTVVVKGDASTLPKLSDGSTLPNHGEYQEGRVWREFFLGDFTLHDSPIANFIDAFPTGSDLVKKKAQINVYDVVVELKSLTAPPIELHFDLYNSVQSGNQAKFAPFSHDAGGDLPTTFTPEPASFALMLIGVTGCGAFAARRKRGRRPAEPQGHA
jgi:hypothetical protein